MSRCSKCDGCTSMWDIYRPDWCNDAECPEGAEKPGKAEREEALRLHWEKKQQQGGGV